MNTTQVSPEGGFAASSEVVNLANPTAALTPTQINKLAYGDGASGGMMGTPA